MGLDRSRNGFVLFNSCAMTADGIDKGTQRKDRITGRQLDRQREMDGQSRPLEEFLASS